MRNMHLGSSLQGLDLLLFVMQIARFNYYIVVCKSHTISQRASPQLARPVQELFKFSIKTDNQVKTVEAGDVQKLAQKD